MRLLRTTSPLSSLFAFVEALLPAADESRGQRKSWLQSTIIGGGAEMHERSGSPAGLSLDPFIGEWSMQAVFPDAPPSGVRGLATFEWLADPALLVQRWEVQLSEAPDGIAIIRFDEARGTYRQHYFDSRGVARVYEMAFSGGVWTLLRTSADLSPLDFAQRFTGSFDADANTITGRWEISQDGSRWEHDFELVYTRVNGEPGS